MSNSKKIIVIGGGASGFFAAINAAINFPTAHITILISNEKFFDTRYVKA